MSEDEAIGARVRAALRHESRKAPLPQDFAALIVPRLLTPINERPRAGRLAAFAATIGVAAVLAIVFAVYRPPAPSTSSGGPGASATAEVSASPGASAAVIILQPMAAKAHGLTFARPATWLIIEPLEVVIPGPVFYLTNGPVLSACPAQGECWPVDALPANGVLIVFRGSAVVVPPEDQPPGVLTVDAAPECVARGGDLELVANRENLVVTACLRGPDLAALKQAFVDLVASVQLGN